MGNRQQAFVRVRLAKGGELDGYLSFQQEVGPDVVLYVHGFGSTRGGAKAQSLESACARRGWSFAAYDFRGHGRSTGSLMELCGSGLLDDLQAIKDDLLNRGVRRVFPVGSSMGGWAAGWYAAGRADGIIPAIGMIAPALRFLQRRWETLSPETRAECLKTGRMRIKSEWVDTEIGIAFANEIHRFHLDALASRWATPLLIYHGMGDETVPVSDSIEFVERTPFADIELRLLKGGDHRLLPQKDELAEEFCRFFGRWRVCSKTH